MGSTPPHPVVPLFSLLRPRALPCPVQNLHHHSGKQTQQRKLYWPLFFQTHTTHGMPWQGPRKHFHQMNPIWSCQPQHCTRHPIWWPSSLLYSRCRPVSISRHPQCLGQRPQIHSSHVQHFQIFNFINHNILTQWLASFSFNIKTTNLIKGFLTGCRTQISYNSYLSDPHNIPNSIPQGSPLSPILSIIYSAPLLTIRELTLCGISTLMYIDDSILLTLSASLSINSTRLQNTYPLLEKALTDIGLKSCTFQTGKVPPSTYPASTNP